MNGIKVIKRDAARDAQTVREVAAAVSAQDIPRAVRLAREALAAGVIHPLLLNLRSHWLTKQGHSAEALDDLRTAMALAPRDIFVRNALGVLLGKTGNWTEALAVLQETVEIAPGFAPAHFSLGWVREFTGELDKAKLCFETAARLDPNFADPHAHLASLAYRRADWAGTDVLAARALKLDPENCVALTALAAAALAQGQLERTEALLARLSGRSDLPPTEAALYKTVLGDLRDAQGRYAEAFAAYSARNDEKFAQAAPRYDIEGSRATDYVQWLTDYFAAAPQDWARPAGEVPDDPRDGAVGHVFLVGFPRSGTTLLENVLASHPDVCTLDERDTLGEAARKFLVDDAGLVKLAVLGAQDIVEQRAIYWRRVREFGAEVGGKIYVDKYPLNSLKLPLVAKLFPKARILFALRDPRDVIFSCFRRDFSLNSSMFALLKLEGAARFYGGVMGLSALYRGKLGLAWRDLRYETLVEQFEEETRSVCDFIGVTWNAQMIDFAELARKRTIKTPSSTQVVRGLYREGAGQWRNYATQLAPAIAILQPWIEKYGYETA
jgi:tetratricopeptide (TPR) repeat protein